MTKPKFGDPDFLPWWERQLAKREIKKLNRKVKALNRELKNYQEQRNKQLEFEFEFRKFYARFERRKWKSDWPFERFLEALLHLKESLPK
jgi:hypothetical protein